jgi:hypothetical protein
MSKDPKNWWKVVLPDGRRTFISDDWAVIQIGIQSFGKPASGSAQNEQMKQISLA